MKFPITIFILVLLCAAILTGCGESQKKSQMAVQELEQAKKECADAIAALEAAQQKVASLNTSLAEQEKTIQELNDSVKTGEASVAEKNARVDRLTDLEESAFADADAAYKSGDRAKALIAYKAFARDFPFSSQNDLAKDKIKEINQSIAHDKWVADAPYRAARAAQAAAQAQAAQQAQNSAAASDAYNAGYSKGQYVGKNQGIGANSSGDYLTEAQVDFYVNRHANDVSADSRDSYLSGFRAGFDEAYQREVQLHIPSQSSGGNDDSSGGGNFYYH